MPTVGEEGRQVGVRGRLSAHEVDTLDREAGERFLDLGDGKPAVGRWHIANLVRTPDAPEVAAAVMNSGSTIFP